MTYSDFHALARDKLHTAHNVLLHLDKLRQLAGEIGAEGAGGVFTEGMACRESVSYQGWRIEIDVFISRWRGPAQLVRGAGIGVESWGSRPDQAASGFVPVGSGPVARGRMREVEIRDQDRNRISLTDATLSEPSVGFGGGHWGWGVLDLGGGRSARLAHGISAMHGGGG